PDDGLIVTRTIAAGELLPASALGDAASEQWASVVLSVSGGLPQGVGPGSMVDIWAARKVAAERYDAPQILVQDVAVVRLTQPEAFMTSAQLEVELLVSRTSLARVLESVAAADVLSLVPVHLPLER